MSRAWATQICIAVDEYDLRNDATHHHGVGGGRADLTGATIPIFIRCLLCQERILQQQRAIILHAKQRSG